MLYGLGAPMTIRVIAYRDQSRAHLLTVSAKQEPIVSRAVTDRPSVAAEGGPHFYPFSDEYGPYKSLKGTLEHGRRLATPSRRPRSSAP